MCSSSEDFSSSCVYTDYPGVILLASGSLCRIPALSLSRAQGCCHIRTHLPPCLPRVHDCIFHLCHSACRSLSPSLCHMKPCVSHSPSSHLCEEFLAPLPFWPPPLATFHARRDLITQKLVQRRIVCFYGIRARTAVNLGLLLQPPLGTVQAVGGLSPPHPPLCSISVQLPGALPLPRTPEPYYTHLKRGRRPVEGEGVVSQKITHSRCSINVP